MACPIEEMMIARVMAEQYVRHQGGNPIAADLSAICQKFPRVYYDMMEDAGVLIEALDRYRKAVRESGLIPFEPWTGAKPAADK